MQAHTGQTQANPGKQGKVLESAETLLAVIMQKKRSALKTLTLDKGIPCMCAQLRIRDELILHTASVTVGEFLEVCFLWISVTCVKLL